MTDRIFALTIFLERPIREDDIEDLIKAIRLLRGVKSVRQHKYGSNEAMIAMDERLKLVQYLHELAQQMLKEE